MTETVVAPLVGVIMGSDSDLSVMQAAADALSEFEVPHEVRIISAHRTPEEMIAYGKNAAARGLRVIIAGAGGAAHLPGMVASVTALPVIGVPVGITRLQGLDALLSIVQMPAGVPSPRSRSTTPQRRVAGRADLVAGDPALLARWKHSSTSCASGAGKGSANRPEATGYSPRRPRRLRRLGDAVRKWQRPLRSNRKHIERGADEFAEKRMWAVRAALELGVELHPHEEGMSVELHDLDQLAIR